MAHRSVSDELVVVPARLKSDEKNTVRASETARPILLSVTNLGGT